MMLQLRDLKFLVSSGIILANSTTSRVAVALFSSRHLENFENDDIFFCMKIAEIDMGGGGDLAEIGMGFWIDKDDSGLKTRFF